MPPVFQTEGSTAVLHEVAGRPGRGVTAATFGLALALEARARSLRPRGGLLWARVESVVRETGWIYGLGLKALGCAPCELIIAHLRRDLDALRAGFEGVRCDALGAVLIETDAPVDLTTSRRFKLAAEKSGVGVVLVRHGSQSCTNAARFRWRVDVAHPPEASTRGLSFDVTVLKDPSGVSGRSLKLEWDGRRHVFSQPSCDVATVPCGLAPLPVRRPMAA